MTFTEAAVEVLRRAGKPLHFKEIAELALQENLLSHVGQDPEVTMGQRLAAMAKRDDDRKGVAIAPEGTFALLEWGGPQEVIVEPVAPPMAPAESGAPPYRAPEREPPAIPAAGAARTAHPARGRAADGRRTARDGGPARRGARAAAPRGGAGDVCLREPVRVDARQDGHARRARRQAQQGRPALPGAAAARPLGSQSGGAGGGRRPRERPGPRARGTPRPRAPPRPTWPAA